MTSKSPIAEVDRVYGYEGKIPVAISNETIMYPCSTGITVQNLNTIDVNPKFWAMGDGTHNISCIAVHPSCSMIVAAERRLNVTIFVFGYPSRRLAHQVPSAAKVEIADMCFCHDGYYLAVLSDAPTCSVSVYTADVGNTKITPYINSTAQFGHRLRFLSFNPSNLDIICSSGGGHVVFWHIDKNNLTLVPIEGTVSQQNTRITCHHWLADGSVICGTSGNGLVRFTDFTAPTGTPLTDGLSSDDHAAIMQLALSKSHLVSVSTSGVVTFRCSETFEPVKRFETGIDDATCIVFNAERDSLIVGGGTGALVELRLPGYDGNLTKEKFNLTMPKAAVIHQGFGSQLVSVSHLDGTKVAVIAKNGVLTVVDYCTNTIVNRFNVGRDPEIGRSVPKTSIVAVGSKSGSVRMINCSIPSNLKCILKGMFTDTCLSIMEVDATGNNIAVSDQHLVFFFTVDSPHSVSYLGCVRLNTTSAASAIAFLPSIDAFIVSYSTGDTVLFNIPTNVSFKDVGDDRTIDSSILFVNSWRLDMPVYHFVVAGLYDDNMSLVAHCLDKEGRLYLLDRTLNPERRDRDTRMVKPLTVFRDHEKKGSRILIWREKMLISTGCDGKMVIRDATPYMAHLSPQPVSKERREPITVAQRHVSFSGGIVDVCCSDDTGRIVTAGADGCVFVWNLGDSESAVLLKPNALTVTVPDSNHKVSSDADDNVIYTEKIKKEAAEIDSVRYQAFRGSVQKRIADLRVRLAEIREENNRAEEEEKVALKDFLVDRQQVIFNRVVDNAIISMREEIELENVRRDYVADTITKECWDVMGVKLTPLFALNTPNLVTHNFHERKSDPVDLNLVRKLKFLRLVEICDREKHEVHELEDIYEEKSDELMNTVSPRNADVEKEFRQEALQKLMARSAVEQANDDHTPFLYKPLFVFTRHRAVVQKNLLTGCGHCLRENYNKEFDALVENKKATINKIEERNVACRMMLKELGERREIITPKMHKEETPSLVFNVDESNVPADKKNDPDEKLRLEQVEVERQKWIERHGNDDSSEKALKLWMDGKLDKDIKTLEVNVKKPDFADENSEKYIVPDERSDEQQRLYKEYETTLQKRIEEVNLRRELLQKDFEAMQKQNSQDVKEFDNAVASLSQKRLLISQDCYKIELQQIKLVQLVLLQEERVRVARKIEARRKVLSDKYQRVMKASSHANSSYEQITKNLEELREEEHLKDKNIKHYAPFMDLEFGDMFLRYNVKKNKAAKKQAAAQQSTSKIIEVSNSTQDPFAFLELRMEAKKRQLAEENAALMINLEKPTELTAVPDSLWESYVTYRQDRLLAEKDIQRLQIKHAEAYEELEAAEKVRQEVADNLAAAVNEFETFIKDALEEQYDVDEIFMFQQGQVEVDQAPVVTDFSDAILIKTTQIERLNKLIRESSGEKLALLEEIIGKRKEIALIDWEVEHLIFSMRTLEMQLKHLHTLRVTKQMQEFINGGGEDHNELQRKKLTQKIEHVRKSMSEKIEERRLQMQKLRRTIKDKEMENYILLDQVFEAKTLVDDRRSIRDLQSGDMELARHTKLIRDLRVTRKLEDVAKTQQGEMMTVKKEIDRLRERTFPSFAVVSKRVIGNPDQLH